MKTYQTLIPVADLLIRGETIQPGELVGFENADGVQWCYFSHVFEGIAFLSVLPDAESANDPAMLAEQCFIQRPAVLVTDVEALLNENLTSLLRQVHESQ